jgi:hypothetical protein
MVKKDKFLYIPDNNYDIVEGWYSKNQVVDLLRQAKTFPDIIQFIADMMEE